MKFHKAAEPGLYDSHILSRRQSELWFPERFITQTDIIFNPCLFLIRVQVSGGQVSGGRFEPDL